jgi:hypothetical protein
MIMFKESVILSNDDNAGDLQHTSSIHMSDRVHQQIDYMAASV